MRDRLQARLHRPLTVTENDALAALDEIAGALHIPDHLYGVAWMRDDGTPENAGWYGWASLNGHRVTGTANRRGPAGAAEEIAGQLLVWHTCQHCGRDTYPYPDEKYCHWRRIGPSWHPGCQNAADDPEPTGHGAASA